MKKIFAMMLALALLTMAGAAMAEEFEAEKNNALAAFKVSMPDAVVDYAVRDRDDGQYEWDIFFTQGNQLGVCEVLESNNEIRKVKLYEKTEGALLASEAMAKLAEKKGAIGGRELEAIIASAAMQVPSTYHLVNYVVNSGNIITATANVTLERDGERFSGVSIGDGPIDAAFHAIEQIIGHHYELDDFQVQAITKGREAVGSSLIRLRANGKLYSGNGISTDIIGACIRAYMNALNKIIYEEN